MQPSAHGQCSGCLASSIYKRCCYGITRRATIITGHRRGFVGVPPPTRYVTYGRVFEFYTLEPSLERKLVALRICLALIARL